MNRSFHQGRYEEARTRLEKWLALAREIGHREGEGSALVSLGQLQVALGRTDLARETLNDSLRVLREIGARLSEGYALEGLGNVAEQLGEVEDARRFYEEALASRREISYASGVVAALVALGRLEASQGDEQAATAHIGEAHSLAEELQVPDLVLSATIERARLPGGDLEAALAAVAKYENRVPNGTRMEARFRLWELTQGNEHLEEAHRLLAFTRDHAPEENRETMIANVPLHRDIVREWKEHGGG